MNQKSVWTVTLNAVPTPLAITLPMALPSTAFAAMTTIVAMGTAIGSTIDSSRFHSG